MDTKKTSPLTWLIICSVIYIIFSLIASALAISENRPAEFGGTSTGLSVVQDFFYGQGTAMAPPLYWLVIQAIFTILAPRRNGWGIFGVAGLTVFGLLSGIGALGEPIIKEIFNLTTFNIFKAFLQAGMIILPFLFMVLSIIELLRRRKSKK